MGKIDEIRARHAAATKGPWKFTCSPESSLYGANERILSFGGRYGYEEYRGQEPGMDDEAFIQHSWEDVQHLLAEIERKDEALRFYADRESYRGFYTAGGYWKAPANDDDGKRAREAL